MAPFLKSALACGVALACASAFGFELSSSDVKPDGKIGIEHVFKGFGCDGGNQSPALNWKDPPAGTMSFAVMVHDPDAPTGGAGWWHWVVYNLPAGTTSLPQGAGSADGKGMPAGAVQQKTDFGASGWGGPCPPAGAKPHHYNFTVYALKVEKLDVPADATASLIGFMVNANALAHARFTGMYGR